MTPNAEEAHAAASNPLEERARLQEPPLRSSLPVVGRLLTLLRRLWLDVAAGWYLRALVQQQNDFNDVVARQITEQQERLLQQDREITRLTRQLAELETHVKQLSRRQE